MARRPRPLALFVLLVATLAAGCESAGEDRVLAIEGTGTVQGFVYSDANGNRQLDVGDPPVRGVGVRLVLRGTRDTLARAQTNPEGLFVMMEVSVGSYVALLNETTLGDTLRVVRIDTEDSIVEEGESSQVEIAVAAGKTVPLSFAVSFPKVTVAQARTLAVGRKVFVEGIALNGPGTFGDSTAHLTDSSGSIRMTRVRSPLVTAGAGDSLRFLGTTSTRDGQPTLDDVKPFFVASVGLPPPEQVATAAAAGADDGRLDGAQIQVVGAAITDTATLGKDFRLTVDDGSGPTEVLLDGDAPISTRSYAPDAVLDVTGLLVPAGAGAWRLKPRFDADITAR